MSKIDQYRSKKMALEMFLGFGWIETPRSKFGPIFSNIDKSFSPIFMFFNEKKSKIWQIFVIEK